MQTETTSAYYQSIHNLPLNKFIDCIVDNNLSALTISGFPTQEELSAAWETILSQYTELVGSQEYKMYKILYCDVANLKITLDQIAIAVNILRHVQSDYFAKEVNELLKTNCKFNWADQKTYQDECDKCMRRSKALKIQYDLKNLQFQAIEKKNNSKPGEKMDRTYFTSMLITLSNYAKFRIDSSITMDEYCLRIKDYIEYSEQVNKKT